MEGVGVAVVEGGDCFAVGGGEDVGPVRGGEVGEVPLQDGDGCRNGVGEAAAGGVVRRVGGGMQRYG